MNFQRILCVVFSILLFIMCTPGRQNNLLDMLFNDNQDIVKRAIIAFHKMGKSAIPLLIDSIDNARPMKIILESPRNSTIEIARPRGFVAAYLIEWILAIDHIDPDDMMKSPYLLGNDLNNYIYSPCIVIDGREALAEDLIVIKKLYQEWWRNNSFKELDELRHEWKQNIRPLSGTAFSWQ